MRIAINTLGPSKLKAGIGRYVSNLVNYLAKIDFENEYFIFANKDNIGWFSEINNANFKIIKVGDYSKIKPIRILWEQTIFPLHCITKKIDLLHSPGFTLPFIKTCRQAVTIHDMTFFTHKQHHSFFKRFYFPFMIKISAENADIIFADSENSKKNIINILSVNPYKVRVVHLGIENYFYRKENIKSVLEKYKIKKKYILFVGTIEPRKNLINLVEAFSKINKREIEKDLELVICGKLGWMYDELFSKINKLKIKERIRFLGFVPDQDLPFLYSGAEMFVYPSFYEGFGLPVIEAMACGCPVITSNISSMKEIAEGASVLVDPNDSESISSAINLLLSNKKLKNELIASGLKRAKMFNCLSLAEKTFRGYQELKKLKRE